MPNLEGSLFIVDNGISGRTGLDYLKEWTEISKSFDIATGYFEISSLLELDGHWQKVDKIRILMGDETSTKSRKILLSAIKERTENYIDSNLDFTKDTNPFLRGTKDIEDAIRSGKIEIRVFNESKFHAKTYITHPRLEAIGSKALVGSSNFTKPGLTQNIELNVQIQSSSEVIQLQGWFEEHWNNSVEISEDILKIIKHHRKAWSPFDVYSLSLMELFQGQDEPTSAWEKNTSIIFKLLDQYQKEAYWSLIKLGKHFGGAFLCDGVGLGKTYVGLMIIERMINDKKHVVLFSPKGAKEAVWEPKLKELLPESSGKDFSNLAVFSHTDFQREGDYPDRLKRIAEKADVIIVDEAHHFRNTGTLGNQETGEKRSRYYKFMDLIHNGDQKKTIFMLTATPINNSLVDLRHMIELITNKDDGYFSKTLGIHNIQSYFSQLQRNLREALGQYSDNISENLNKATDFLKGDELFQNLIVQRSRLYAINSQKNEGHNKTLFPEKAKPKVAEYSIFKTYSGLLDLIERAFSRSDPLFFLSVYNPLKFYLGDPDEIDDFEKGRKGNVVSLIRTQFLKRFESSVYAFETSCDRLLIKLLAFQKKHCETPEEKKKLEKWIFENKSVYDFSHQKQLDLWGESDEDTLDLIPDELLENWEKLERDKYDVASIIEETFLDLNQIIKFLEETKKFDPKSDDKLKKLIRMLNSKEFHQKKVLIFTEFADTARYIEKYLKDDGMEGVERIDGGSGGERYGVVKKFSPYYNSSSSSDLKEGGIKEIRVLVATDVLSEGLNLQDCNRMINYDIHWNPVRLMQRIGRVDRRMDPEVEKRLERDHPEVYSDRGKVFYWNFLPPAELNRLLSLYQKVTEKTLLISETMGIEGKKLITPDDELNAIREFNSGYEGEQSLTESLYLELQQMLRDIPNLREHLDNMPNSIFSSRSLPKDGTKGIFFCYKLPRWNEDIEDFSIDDGRCKWYLYETNSGNILEETSDIIKSIKCELKEPRKEISSEDLLIEIRDKVKKYIKDTYLKKIDSPVYDKSGVPLSPKLLAWMEIN